MDAQGKGCHSYSNNQTRMLMTICACVLVCGDECVCVCGCSGLLRKAAHRRPGRLSKHSAHLSRARILRRLPTPRKSCRQQHPHRTCACARQLACMHASMHHFVCVRATFHPHPNSFLFNLNFLSTRRPVS